MHKNNRIYLVNILHSSQPWRDSLNRTGMLDCLSESTWQTWRMHLHFCRVFSSCYLFHYSREILTLGTRWHREKRWELSGTGEGHRRWRGVRRKKVQGVRKTGEAGKKDGVSCVKRINASRSFVVCLSWALPSQNAMCKLRSWGPQLASPSTVIRLQTSTAHSPCVRQTHTVNTIEPVCKCTVLRAYTGAGE